MWRLTELAAFSLAIAASSCIRLIIAERSGYPGCSNKWFGNDTAMSYRHWVMNCQEGHHYGVGECVTDGSYWYTPCTACPPFMVSFTVEDYSDHDDDYVYSLDNYTCIFKVQKYQYLYGIVMNTTGFVICITLLVLIVLCLLSPTKKEERSLSVALTVLVALPCLDYFSDLSYFLTVCFRFLPCFVICFLLLIVPWIQFGFKLVHVKAHPTMVVEIPEYLLFKEYDNMFKTAFAGLVYFVFLTINGLILWFIFGGFLYATKLFTITRVSNFWYFYWFGDNRMESDKVVIDSAEYNVLVYSEVIYESIPQFIIQVINSKYLDNDNIVGFSATSYFSIIISSIVIANGLYRLIYFKCVKNLDILDVPLDLTLGGNIPSNKWYKTSPDNIDPADKSALSTVVTVNRVEPIEDRLNPLVGTGPLLDDRLQLIEMKIKDVQSTVLSETKSLYTRISNLEEIVASLSKKEDTIVRL